MTFRDRNLNYEVHQSSGLPRGYSLITKRDVKQLALFRLQGDTLKECFSHPLIHKMNEERTIYYDRQAHLFYIPTNDRRLYIVTEDGTEKAVFNNLDVCRFIKNGNELWAVGYEEVWNVNPSGVELKFRFPEKIEKVEDFNVIMDTDGNLIIRDYKSLRRYRNGRFETIIDKVNIPRSMMFDREGNLWLTSRQGVYNFFKMNMLTYAVNASDADIVYSVVPTGENNGYFTTGNGKLIRYENDKFREITYPQHPEGTSFSYRSIAVDNAIYFTTYQDVLQYKNGRFRWLNLPPDIYHVASCRINDKEFAVGGWNMLFVLDNDGRKIREISHKNIQRHTIYTVQADNENRLWIGGHQGICRIGENDTLYFFNDSTMNGEASVKDRSGRIWFTCESHIYYVDGDTIRLFMEFPNTILANICYTRDNLIVVSDNTGIKIIDPQTKQVVEYDYSNGYSSGEPHWNTMIEDDEGNVWLCTQGPNVVKFNPVQLIQNHYTTVLYLTSAQYSTNNVNKEDMENGASLNYNQRNIRFSFVGLCYSNPENVRYSYRLRGFQDDWSEPVKLREVTFNNLPPGDYVFEIYVDVGTDESRSETQSFVFSIKPAFWQTIWFLIICIILLMLASAGVALYIQRKKNKALLEKLRAEKELNELRISSIRLKAIPHFNANVLAAIEYYIANRTKEEAMRILGIYSDFTFKTLSEVDKAARPLSEELAYVKMYLDLEKIRFLDKFDFRIKVEDDVNKSVQLPNMILHTYCENAVKHGLMPLKSGGLLTIRVSQRDHIVCVSVEDNGVGRAYTAQNPHFHSSKQGLSILNRQIEIYNRFNREKISQQVEDLFKNGKPNGTLFTVEVPLDFTYIN
jgi:streptogramin lyase